MKNNFNRTLPSQKIAVYHMLLMLLTALLFLVGCQMANPPRLATATAKVGLESTPTSERMVLTVGDELDAAASQETNTTPQNEPNPTISVWINETSAEHEAILKQMTNEFTDQARVDVELKFVPPLLLPDLVKTAVLSDTLPDIIIHPMEYTHGWVTDGILDPVAADTAVGQIGPETFNPSALELMTIDGRLAAIPSDGYQQLLIYRNDWFAEANLAIPDNFAAMINAAEATTDRDNQRAGFVIPTEANLVSTYQIFEQIALANGCDLIDDKGEVLLLEPVCLDALDFYFRIVNQFSPIGVQTVTSTENAYLAERTGLIITSPAILPYLAEAGLVETSSILTEIRGQGATAVPTSFGHITNLGITTKANLETAVAFANYWFNNGYEKWLSINSERKVPMRWGTKTDPDQFIDNWGKTPLPGGQSLVDLFGDEIVADMRDGIAETSRWGFPQGQGELITRLYEDQTLSVTLQEMLSGYFNPEQTIIEAYNRVTDLIPNYQYYLEQDEEIEEE